MRWISRLAKLLLGDYAIYQLWRLDDPGAAADSTLTVRPLAPADLASADPVLLDTAWYLGDEAHGFGCFDGARVVGVAYYWHGQRYEDRHSWPIEAGAAKLVHIVTAPAERRRGVAQALITASAAEMRRLGFNPLYARVWHSNRPSQATFARAGWKPIAWLLQANPLRLRRPWIVSLRSVRRDDRPSRTEAESTPR